MMIKKELIMTKGGYEELLKRLEYLKTEKRHEVAARIKTAREYGDLSENAEYDEAKNEQGFVEGEINDIEAKLQIITVIDDDDVHTDDVSVGSFVKALDEEYNEVVEYQIVGSAESNLSENKLSNESPIGKALIGSKVGDRVVVYAPAGEFKYEILEIYKKEK